MELTQNLRTGKQKRTGNRLAVTERVQAFLKDVEAKGESLEAVRLLLRERAKKDFWFFQYHVYGNTDTLNGLHMDLCARYQARINKQFSLWLMPRSHLKTSTMTEAGSLWEVINHDGNLRILIGNAKLDNAVDILANIRNCVEHNEVFRWLFPEYCPDLAPKSVRSRCKWLTHRLDFPCSKYAGRREGNLEIIGVEASLVSKHYDVIILDDPINDINTTTKDYRDKIYRWFKNLLQLRHDLTTSIIRLIGTRWHFDDLYSRLIKNEYALREEKRSRGLKVTPRLWIYLRQVVEKVESGGQTIVGYDDVQPIWPERFTAVAIEELRYADNIGSYIFSCQYMNNPLPEEDAIFKHSDIDIIDEYAIPEDLVYFVACDIAVEDIEFGDWWVITVAGFDSHGEMYVREIIREKLLTSTFLQQLGQIVRKWKPVKVGIETTAFQKTLLKIYKQWAVKNNINIPWVEMERGNRSKLKRFLALQPRVERGDFHIEEGIRNCDWCIEEMTTYPRSTYDDILDTLADLEALFYAAPEHTVDITPKDTFKYIYGDIEDDEQDTSEAFASDIINEESLYAKVS